MPNLLPDSPAKVTQRVLIALGLCSDPDETPSAAWPAAVGEEIATTPDDVVTLYDVAGQDDGRTMSDGELQQHHGLKVRVRSGKRGDGWAKADAIRAHLAQSVYGMTIGVGARTYLIHCYSGIMPILSLGKEAGVSKRSVFTLNALVSLRQLS